ncbi:MAG: cytochrome c oxidase subunit [Actinomycetota bacterium]|jgi:cytochrome c oxidase subunit 1|nr:cytochrome c oxidase subunit [Actinomycetota bacterium]
MAMTETSPASDQTPAAAAAPPAPAPVDPAGLAGWLSTSDHKRVGRLWIATSLLFLLVGGVLGELLGGERLSSGADILKNGTFAQVSTLHSEAAVLLFLVPFFIGLATYLVPLQIGSPEIAFPRGSATAYWGYVVGGLLLCGSYVADGGITGTTSTSVDLTFLSIVLLAASLALGVVSAVTTALTMRAPGLDLMRAPLFTWSAIVGGGLLLLELPVLASRAIELFVQHHYGNDIGSYRGIAAFWSLPGTSLLVVMAAGVLLEVVPTIAGRPLRFHAAGIGVLGAMGILGIGGWVLDPKATDDILYVGVGLAAIVPALALLGLLGDTARAGSPKLKAPLVLALASALLLLAGAAAGAVEVIEPLKLLGTTWQAGQVHLTLFGGGTLAAFAALWFWAPKIWGQHLSERAGFLVALLVLGGAVLLAAPDLVTGAAEDQPRAALEWDSSDTVTTSNAISLVGGGLGALGAIVAVGAVAGAAVRKRGVPAVDDPWGGWTLEWRTASPPPTYNFEEIPDVTDKAGA